MSPQERSSMMLELANRWPESGLTQIRYAQANNLSVHTLKYWLYKVKRPSNSLGGFIQIKELSMGSKFVVRYPNGVELKISSNTPIAVIKSLVNL